MTEIVEKIEQPKKKGTYITAGAKEPRKYWYAKTSGFEKTVRIRIS